MEIRLAGKMISKYNKVSVNLKYDSVADTFSFELYPDDTNSSIFSWARKYACTIWHEGELLITGKCWMHKNSDSAKPSLMTIQGYSTTGVLASSHVAPNILKIVDQSGDYAGITTEEWGHYINKFTPQDKTVSQVQVDFSGLTLYQIATTLCKPFGITVNVGDLVQKECTVDVYDKTNIDLSETIASYLTKLAFQKHVILSHDKYGNLLLTRPKTQKPKPVHNIVTATIPPAMGNRFAAGSPNAGNTVSVDNITTVMTNIRGVYDFTNENQDLGWTKMEVSCEADKLHSFIQVVGDYTAETETTIANDPANDSAINPYCSDLNISRYQQTKSSTDTTDAALTARYLLGNDLKSIKLNVDIPRWTFGKNLIRPNQIISVTNENLNMSNPVRWFIEEVHFAGDEKSETSEIKCVLPECYNDSTVTYAFD